jgi:hypothetical protein
VATPLLSLLKESLFLKIVSFFRRANVCTTTVLAPTFDGGNTIQKTLKSKQIRSSYEFYFGKIKRTLT